MLQYASGHRNNVFQARVMPESGNRTVVSCAADGQVRVASIPEGTGGARVETRKLAKHQGRAHKLALEPGSAHCFYSCGEDGEVRHFDLREPAAGNRRLLVVHGAHVGRAVELNSIDCSALDTRQFCLGGADEVRWPLHCCCHSLDDPLPWHDDSGVPGSHAPASAAPLSSLCESTTTASRWEGPAPCRWRNR